MTKGKKMPEKRSAQAQGETYCPPTLEVKKLSKIVTLTSY